MNKTVVLAACLLLGGCAQGALYDWGVYEQKLYESYKNPAAVHELRAALEEQIAAARRARQRVPPGLYAEVGTLYLQEGLSAKAIEYYRLERDAWPESRGLMDTIVANLERSGGAGEAAQ